MIIFDVNQIFLILRNGLVLMKKIIDILISSIVALMFVSSTLLADHDSGGNAGGDGETGGSELPVS